MTNLLTVRAFDKSEISLSGNDIIEEDCITISGQIDIIVPTSSSNLQSTTNTNYVEYSNALELYPDYEIVITDFYNKYGIIPMRIGYTTTIENDSFENGVNSIGGTSSGPYGNFTLYTAASYNGSSIYASSLAIYNRNNSIDRAPALSCYDYISLTFDLNYIIRSDYSIATPNYANYRADEVSNGAVMGVLLNATPSAPPYLRATMNGVGLLNVTKPKNNKIISSYKHCYVGTQGSVSLDGWTGLFSLTNVEKYWTVSSSVIL